MGDSKVDFSKLAAAAATGAATMAVIGAIDTVFDEGMAPAVARTSWKTTLGLAGRIQLVGFLDDFAPFPPPPPSTPPPLPLPRAPLGAGWCGGAQGSPCASWGPSFFFPLNAPPHPRPLYIVPPLPAGLYLNCAAFSEGGKHENANHKTAYLTALLVAAGAAAAMSFQGKKSV